MRSERRHHLDRIKQRMRRYVRGWFKTPRDPEFIGKMAACHGTHDCYMCKQEKYEGKAKVRREINRILEL